MKIRRIAIFLLVFLLQLESIAFAKVQEDRLNILFTHDLHEHIEAFDVLKDGSLENIGGYERLYREIEKDRKKDKDLLLIDGGDYSMGTLFQTIYSSENPSLRLLGKMDYDAVTLGNHEFDFKVDGLSSSLEAAINSKDPLPSLVASNLDLRNYEGVDREKVAKLESVLNRYEYKEYDIIEKRDLKIGIFGIMGYEAISNSPVAGVNFKDPIEASKEVVKKLREEDVDLIIGLSHSGTSEKKKKSEDEILARKVDGIDLIISGHTHTTLEKPIIVNDTIIASSGRYTENIGRLTMVRQDGKWSLESYSVDPLVGEVAEKRLEKDIAYFKERVQKDYLDLFGLGYDQILARVDYNFVPAGNLGQEHVEEPLANLIGDSFIDKVKRIEGEKYKKIDAAIVPAGTIRDSFVKGYITVSDVFNVNSLGIGPDNISGYPLIEVYLTGKDLKTAAEVDGSIAPIMKEAQLYISGLNYTFNPNRLIFNKVSRIGIVGQDGRLETIEDEKLYRVVAGLYTGQMLSIVKDQSFGLLSITPRDKNGVEIVNFDDHIIYDEDREVKEWYAVADYISSFEKEDGVSKIPQKYSKVDNRKNIDKSSSLRSFFTNPNNLARKVYSIVFLFIFLLIILGGFLFRKKGSKKKTN